MKVTIKAYTTIKDRIPNYPDNQELVVDLTDTATVLDMLQTLSIPAAEVGLVLVNGTFSSLETVLHQGDAVQIFSFIEGG